LRRAVGGGRRRQVGLVAVEGDVDPAVAEQCEAVAVVGVRVGTVVARMVRTAGGAGSKAAGSVGAVEVGAERGIAGFLAVCLTDMVVAPNRSNEESRSAATARKVRRGRNAGAAAL